MSDTGPSFAEGVIQHKKIRSEKCLTPQACHLVDQENKSKEKKSQKYNSDAICPSV